MKILRFNEFLNENKIYSNLKQITDKLKGDETTENKVVIMGLFRENPNFKGVDPLKITLEELENRYKKQYETSIEKLKVSFKGNDDMVEKYLKAYCDNIKTLGNKAVPFSYKDPEKTLIDIVNNNQQIKGNSNEKLISIDNIDKKDIVFENDEVVIIYIPTQQHAIKYGKGQTQCIAKPSLRYFPIYRINHKATIYYVLFKKRNADDNKKLCAILRYPNNNYGIADKTNSGDFTGGGGYYFEDVEHILKELEGKEECFKYVELTDKEIKIEEVSAHFINKNDITSEIEKICNEYGFDKKEFFTSYVLKNDILSNQFKYFTDDMQEFYIETGKEIKRGDQVHIPDKYMNRYININYNNIVYGFLANTPKVYNNDLLKVFNKATDLYIKNNTHQDEELIDYLSLDIENANIQIYDEYLKIQLKIFKNIDNYNYYGFITTNNPYCIKTAIILYDNFGIFKEFLYYNEKEKYIKKQLDYGLDISKIQKTNNDFVKYLVLYYDVEYDSFKILIDYGLDVNMATNITQGDDKQSNCTLLDALIIKDADIKIIELFIEHGAIMNNEYLLNKLSQDKRKKIESLLEH